METFGLNRHFILYSMGFSLLNKRIFSESQSIEVDVLVPLPYLRLQSALAADQMEMSQDVTGHLHTRDTLSLCHVMWRTCYVTANVHIPNITIPGSLLAAWLKLSPPPPLRCVSPEPSAASGSWGCCYQLVKFFVFTSPHRYNNTAGEGWNGDTGFTFTAT